jgi:hypothetical protein
LIFRALSLKKNKQTGCTLPPVAIF